MALDINSYLPDRLRSPSTGGATPPASDPLSRYLPARLGGAAPDPEELPEPIPEHGIWESLKDTWQTVTSPIPAIQTLGKQASEAFGYGTETEGNQDPGRPFIDAGPDILPRQVRGAIRGLGAGFYEEAIPNILTPLDLATAPLPAARLAKLGTAGHAIQSAMRGAELAGGAGLVAEGAGDVVEGVQRGDLAQIGGGAFRAGMGGLMAGTARPRNIEDAIRAREAAGDFADVAPAPPVTRDPFGQQIVTPDLPPPMPPDLGNPGFTPPVWPLEAPSQFTPTRPHIPPPVDVLAERDFLRPNLEAEVNAEQARLGREFLKTPEMQGRNLQTYQRLSPEEQHAIGVAGLKISDVNAMPLEEAQELVRPLLRSRKPAVSPEAEQAAPTATLDNTAMVDDRRSDSVFDRRAEEPPIKVPARLDRRRYGPDDRRAMIAEEFGFEPDSPAVQRIYEAETDPISQLPGPSVYDRDIKTHTGAVASMDLAGLKWVNDTLGHQTGDSFLRAVGEAAQDMDGVRMYRKGGDEFVLLADTEDAADLAAKSIQERFANAEISYRQPDGQVVNYTRGRLDYGVGQGTSGPESFAAADQALYRTREEAKARGERADRGTRPPGLVELPASGRGTVDQAPVDGPKYATAYHGTPHDFDEFKLNKDTIGTGEGAQAYGHGLYFTGKREIGEHYRKALSRQAFTLDDGPPVDLPTLLNDPKLTEAERRLLNGVIDDAPGASNVQLLQELKRKGDYYEGQYRGYGLNDGDAWMLEYRDAARSLERRVKEQRLGKLYEVELAPNEDEYLLWDKPLSQQSENVKAALANDPDAAYLADEPAEEFYRILAGQRGRVKSDGQTMRSLGSKEAASEYLRERGVPGIKYLDGSSRGQGEGSYNYVIFDDSLVKVRDKFRAAEKGKVAGGLDHKAIQRAFPTGKISQVDGSHIVDLPHGRQIRVTTGGDIEYNASAFKKGYDRDLSEGEEIVGSWQKLDRGGVIQLAKEGDEGTLNHEVFHSAMDLVLSPREKARILEKYGSEEKAADAYAAWNPKTEHGLFQKIAAFFKRIYHQFKPSWESAFGEVKSGKAFERVGEAEGGDTRYAAREMSPKGGPGDKATNPDAAPGGGNDDAWFAGSKLADQNGKPLVLFHGTRHEFDSLQPSKGGEYGPGIYLSDFDGTASMYASRSSGTGPERVLRAHVALKNPFYVTKQEWLTMTAGRDRGSVVKRLREKGHDGIIATGLNGLEKQIVAWSPDQVRILPEVNGPQASGPKYATAPKTPPEAPKRIIRPIPDTPLQKARAEAPNTKGEGFGQPQGEPDIAPNVNRMNVPDKTRADAQEVIADNQKGLKRESVEHWEDLDPEIARIQKEVTDEQLYKRAASSKLSTAEEMALSARVDQKAREYEEALRKNDGKADKELLAKALVAAARPYANAGTDIARLLNARKRLVEASESVSDKFLRKVFKEIPNIEDADAAKLLHLYHNEPERLPDAIVAAMKPGMLRRALSVWKAGLLSAFSTDAANLGGGFAESGVGMAETMLSAGIDKLLLSRYGGSKERFVSEAGAEVAGYLEAFPAALKTLGKDLKDVYSLKDQPVDLERPFAHQFGSGRTKVERVFGTSFGKLGVEDKFTKTIAAHSALRKLAIRKAQGDQAKASKIVQEALEGKHLDLVEAAGQIAKGKAFQDDPGKITQWLTKLTNDYPAFQVILPFVQTPAVIAKRTVERSPAGFVKAYKTLEKFKKGEATRGEVADAFARPVLGTMILGGFVGVAKSGMMTGSGPSDPREKGLLRDTGWQPYSFKVPMGGKTVYIPFNRFEPVSSILGFAADLAEMDDQKQAGDMFDKALGSIVENLTSKTYLQGLSDAANAISQPKQFLGQYASNLAGSAVPNIISRANQAIDPTLRETRPDSTGLAGIPERIGKTIASRVPGLAQKLPERRNAQGDVLERPGNAVTRFLSPVQPSTDKGAEADLERAFLDAEFIPSKPARQITLPRSNGKKLDLTEQELEVFVKADQAVTARLRRVVQSSQFRRMDPLRQKSYLRNQYQRAQDSAQAKLFASPSFRARAAKAKRT